MKFSFCLFLLLASWLVSLEAAAQHNFILSGKITAGQWKFSGDKHKSLQVDTERTFHQRYPLVML